MQFHTDMVRLTDPCRQNATARRTCASQPHIGLKAGPLKKSLLNMLFCERILVIQKFMTVNAKVCVNENHGNKYVAIYIVMQSKDLAGTNV